MNDGRMIYTRHMMKPGESFILIRTGDVYTVSPLGGLVFNESKKKWTKLNGNCHVQPITKKREVSNSVLKEEKS